MFSQAVSQTVGVESGSADGCVSASFSVAGGVAGGTFEEGGAFCRGFSCEREGAGGLDMGEGCAGASVSSSKDACRASLMAEETGRLPAKQQMQPRCPWAEGTRCRGFC